MASNISPPSSSSFNSTSYPPSPSTADPVSSVIPDRSNSTYPKIDKSSSSGVSVHDGRMEDGPLLSLLSPLQLSSLEKALEGEKMEVRKGIARRRLEDGGERAGGIRAEMEVRVMVRERRLKDLKMKRESIVSKRKGGDWKRG